jgi:hypothetical protein
LKIETKEMIVPLNACDLIPLATLKNYPKQSFSIIYSIYDHLLTPSQINFNVSI